MIVPLVLALVVVAFICYTCCRSSPVLTLVDELIADTMEDSTINFETRTARDDET